MLVFLLKCSVHLEGGFMETRLNEDHSGFPMPLREECAVQRLQSAAMGVCESASKSWDGPPRTNGV